MHSICSLVLLLVSRLKLPAVPTSGTYCLRFAYHMYGWHIDTLRIDVEGVNASATELWSDSGRKGNYWISQTVSRPLQSGDRIVFVGIRGGGYSGDIGLDTIRLNSGDC